MNQTQPDIEGKWGVRCVICKGKETRRQVSYKIELEVCECEYSTDMATDVKINERMRQNDEYQWRTCQRGVYNMKPSEPAESLFLF